MQQRGNQHRFTNAKQRMLDYDLKGRDITNQQVLRVMAEIPREKFVLQEYLSQAYSDGPLPIGMDQTISQPYIVALMTQLLKAEHDHDVLEIGTGSGYQTAVLSRLAKRIYTIEKYAELYESAQQVLTGLGITNVQFHMGDGSCGWPQDSLPASGYFDRIMVTAAVPDIPQPLVKQLVETGLIVAPVGYGSVQQLILGKKLAGKLVETPVCGCRFVRLVGKHGFQQ